MKIHKNLTTRLSIALLITIAIGSIIFSVIFFTAYERMEYKMLDVLEGYAAYESKRDSETFQHLEKNNKPTYIEIYHSKENIIPEILSHYTMPEDLPMHFFQMYFQL